MIRKSLYTLGAILTVVSGGVEGYATLHAPPPTAVTSTEQQSLKPLAPQLKAEFRVDVSAESSSVHIQLTVPSMGRDDNWTDFNIEYVEQLILYRSKGYEENEIVKIWDRQDAGRILEFDDTDALEAGEEYTYSAKAVLHGMDGYMSYAYVTYGINPIQPDIPELESAEGGAPVRIRFRCPEALHGSFFSPEPFPDGVEYS